MRLYSYIIIIMYEYVAKELMKTKTERNTYTHGVNVDGVENVRIR